MPFNPTSWFVTHRTRAPHERPRNYNDPSKQHELDHFYDRSNAGDKLKVALLLVPVLGIVALAAFIAFNVLSG